MSIISVDYGTISGGGATYYIDNLTLAASATCDVCKVDNNTYGIISFTDGGYYATWKLKNKTLTKLYGNASSAQFSINANDMLQLVNSSGSSLVYNGVIVDSSTATNVTI